MAFVHPTVTDHDADRVAPPPLSYFPGPPAVYGHLSPPSLVPSEASITARWPSPHIPSSYLSPACSACLLSFFAHTFKSSRSPQHLTLLPHPS